MSPNTDPPRNTDALWRLPPAPRRWLGRSVELAQLDHHARQDSPALIVLSGRPGVGKTALALRWAALHRDEFPDGQFWADLGPCLTHGSARPEDVLAGWLRTLGVPAERVPASLADRAAEWRARTAGQRIVTVLDDAVSAAQVRSLWARSQRGVTLVTCRDVPLVITRSDLAGLAADGARFLYVTAFGKEPRG